MQAIYILYFEKKPEGEKDYRGTTIQCDDLRELIYQLRECEINGHKKVKVITIEGRSQA